MTTTYAQDSELFAVVAEAIRAKLFDEEYKEANPEQKLWLLTEAVFCAMNNARDDESTAGQLVKAARNARILAELDGHNYAEVAHRNGISERQVRRIEQQARAR